MFEKHQIGSHVHRARPKGSMAVILQARMLNAEMLQIFQQMEMNWTDYLDGERAKKIIRRAWARMMKAEHLAIFRQFIKNWQNSLRQMRAEKVAAHAG